LRNHAEVGEGRVSSADAGETKEDFAEVIALGYLLHLGARIGNGDEMLACFVFADNLLHAVKEILFKNIWFQSASGLAGHDAQSFRKIDLAFNGFDLRRIG
jgi:hypothetical protein